MRQKEFTFKIGGEAGQGILSTGKIFAKSCLISGYFAVGYNAFPSLIRGGHNTYTISVSKEKNFSIKKPVDLLVALNENAVKFHEKELSKTAKIILNSEKISSDKTKKLKKFKIYPVPFISLAKKVGGTEVMQNTVSLGVVFYLLSGDLKILEKTIEDFFGKSSKKSVDIAKLNIAAAEAGFDFAKQNFKRSKNFTLLPQKTKEKLLLLGGCEAIGLGAVKAGCKFFVSYPMTPIRPLIDFFVQKAPELGIVYKQPEDEISAINMALGAGFAGVRAMTATSGGGFSLMVEGYGLAGITETPIVIIEGQRPGPATGMPTWGGQGDLRFVLHASQDEFPRIVLSPGDVEECFWLTIEAFNLAEKYQTPVVILIDKHLAEGIFWTKKFNTERIKIDRGCLLSEKEQKKPYKRYKITSSGISPRALPGRKGFIFVANSDEHDEYGFSNEEPENRKKMMEKRMRKLINCQEEIPGPKIYGQKKAKITLIGWGSTKGPVLEAQKVLFQEGIETKFLHFSHLNPLPQKFLEKFFAGEKKNLSLMIEQNATAQLAGWLREKTGFLANHHFLKYDGRPFFPEEIATELKRIIQ